MAFNLNKKDETVKDSGTPKFDLSKSNTSTPPAIKTDEKSKQWFLAIITVVIAIIIGSWYLLSIPESPIITETALPVISPDNSIPPTTADSVIKSVAPANIKDPKTTTSSEALANKTAVVFGRSSATLSSIDQDLVNKIITYLKQNPASSITVNGYASSEGTLESNQYISQARADTFKTYLVSKGILANRITAISKGIENPIASNATEQGRRQNRRVTITFP